MKLNFKDLVKISLDVFFTLLFCVIIYQALVIIVNRYLYSIPDLNDYVWIVRRAIGLTSFKIPFILLLVSLFTAVAVIRVKKFLEQKQMNFIISELHFIAQGHYDHQISIRPKGYLGQVVDSIHALVKSTTDAMEEERRLEQSKDELVTNVSHDLRTPLTSIIGYLGLIEEGKYQNESQLRQYTHVAYEKAKQMNLLVTDLFEYTKVRNRGAHLNISRFDLAELIEQVAVGFRISAQEANLELQVETPRQRVEMHGDTEKLVRVLENLLSNAIKYGNKGTHIVIRVETDPAGAAFSVSNNGSPIPKESLPNLFERFYRVDASRSKETGGSGLGLAIAKSIVDLHHGTISATSTSEWTTFTVWLPHSSFAS
ncbi:MAG: sensor histidine kinase [Clostridia bacterium]